MLLEISFVAVEIRKHAKNKNEGSNRYLSGHKVGVAPGHEIYPKPGP